MTYLRNRLVCQICIRSAFATFAFHFMAHSLFPNYIFLNTRYNAVVSPWCFNLHLPWVLSSCSKAFWVKGRMASTQQRMSAFLTPKMPIWLNGTGFGMLVGTKYCKSTFYLFGSSHRINPPSLVSHKSPNNLVFLFPVLSLKAKQALTEQACTTSSTWQPFYLFLMQNGGLGSYAAINRLSKLWHNEKAAQISA